MTVNFSFEHKDTKIRVDFAGADAPQEKVDDDDCECTPGRKYAYALKAMAQLNGVSARIKTRYPVSLCCEDDGGTTTAFGVAYCNVTGPGFIWAQSGFGRERTAGSENIKTYRYAEVNGSEYQVTYDYDNAPPDNSLHEYKCDLDSATGCWSFSDNGENWQSFTDVSWEDTLGTDFQYTGEIYNEEDAMAGTAGDKCAFTDCKYRVQDGDFVGAGFVQGDVRSDNALKWGAERVSATAMNIWNIG